jgi:hypothetical protein
MLEESLELLDVNKELDFKMCEVIYRDEMK